MLLIVTSSDDDELNTGPSKKCPKCESFVSTKAITCTEMWLCLAELDNLKRMVKKIKRSLLNMKLRLLV